MVKAEMDQIFSRVIELSDQTFKALGKGDLKACNALALVIKLYKIFNKYPDRFAKTFGSISIYEKLICCGEDLLQFCKPIKSSPAETEKELVCHVRNNLFLKGCRLSLKTLYKLNSLLNDSTVRDGSQLSKMI